MLPILDTTNPSKILHNKAEEKVVFIDPSVEDYPILLLAIDGDAEAFILDSAQDGVEQISQVLTQRSNISTLHILANGSPGRLQLGNSSLDVEALRQNTAIKASVQQWQASFAPDANILLFGCEVAAGERGFAFVQQLNQLTGANIAASFGYHG